MSSWIRWLAPLLLIALAWPEIGAYRGEYLLADAGARVSAALSGAMRGDDAVVSVQTAYAETEQARGLLPGDQRPALSAGIALLLLHRGADAAAILDAAVVQGERPELTLNLGRARGITGDAQGAQAAFLRTAWANPAAVATLPKSIREPLLERVKSLEQDLRDGRLQQPPPL